MPARNYEKAKRILELKNQGLNQTQIAKQLGCTQTNISQIAIRNGIKFDKGGAARNQYGENNPSYKNGMGRSTIERLTRVLVLNSGRCLFTCERCNEFNKLEEQPRHHKDRDRSNNVSENIEVLCQSCHSTE